jgi:hypothetical protein
MQVQMQQTKAHFFHQSQTTMGAYQRRLLSLREEKGLKNEINVRRLKTSTIKARKSLTKTGERAIESIETKRGFVKRKAPSLSEAANHIHKPTFVISTSLIRKGERTTLTKLFIDPSQENGANQCWPIFATKSAQVEMVSSIHKHKSVTHSNGTGITHRSDRLRTRGNHPIPRSTDQQNFGTQ